MVRFGEDLGATVCDVGDVPAVGQNQWCHFGLGAPPILVYFSGDWDVHWGYGILTHGHLATQEEYATAPLGNGCTVFRGHPFHLA